MARFARITLKSNSRAQIERRVFEVQDPTSEELAAYTKEQVEVWKTVRDSGMPPDWPSAGGADATGA